MKDMVEKMFSQFPPSVVGPWMVAERGPLWIVQMRTHLGTQRDMSGHTIMTGKW
jgi:hypothetical protein